MSTILKFKEVRQVFFSRPALSCKADDKVGDVLRLMNTNGTGSIVILNDNGEAEGIFTERDYMKKSLELTHALELPISELMTPNPKTVPENFRLDVAVGIMRLGKFRHLVVTEDDCGTENGILMKPLIEGGDIVEICQSVMADYPDFKICISPLITEHPRLT